MRTEIKILLLASCTLLLFAQCSTDDTITSYKEQQELVETTLAVDLPQVGFTRAEPKYDSSKGALYNLNNSDSVYFILWYKPQQNNKEYKVAKKKICIDEAKEKGCGFTIQLIKGIDYQFKVWAGFYEQGDVAPTHINIEIPSNPEKGDAYYGEATFNSTDFSNQKCSIHLKRPLTKIRYYLIDFSQEHYNFYTNLLKHQDYLITDFDLFFNDIDINKEEWGYKVERNKSNRYNPKKVFTLDKTKILILSTYLYLPELTIPAVNYYSEDPIDLFLHLPEIDLSKDTDNKPVTTLANKLVTIKLSAYELTVLKVVIDNDFDNNYDLNNVDNMK